MKKHHQALGNQSARMEALERQLREEHAVRMAALESSFVEERKQVEHQQSTLTKVIKAELMDGDVKPPPVPE